MSKVRLRRLLGACASVLAGSVLVGGCGDGEIGGDPTSGAGGGGAAGATVASGTGTGSASVAAGGEGGEGGEGPGPAGGAGPGGAGGEGGGNGGGSAPTEPLPPFGTQTIQVPANLVDVHSGLSVKAGQVIKIEASGTWKLFGADYGPGGDEATIENGCPLGALIGRLGFAWKGEYTTPQRYDLCIGASAEITAAEDGILFFSHNFTIGYELDHQGAVDVTITSEGARSPVIPAAEVPDWNFAFVSSEWVELRGQNVYLTVPTSLAAKHQATAPAAVAAFDAWYAAEAELSGAKPYLGEAIRLYPDENIGPFAYGLSGNPIRYVHHAMDSDAPYASVLRAGEKSHSAWVWVHEMGHDFTLNNTGFLTYMVGGGGVEGWANVPGIYALEKTGHPEGASRRPHDRVETCADVVPPYVASGSYAQFREDAWLNLCLVLELRDAFGWELIQKFLSWYNARPYEEIAPLFTADDATRWTWLRDRMNEFAGQDTTPTFQKYKVPLK